MSNLCLNCGKEVKNKYCNVSCQNSHSGFKRADKTYGCFVDFKVNCYTCNTELTVSEREKCFPQKEKYYCNRSCANKRVHTEESKQKSSEALKKFNSLKPKKEKPKKEKKERKKRGKSLNPSPFKGWYEKTVFCYIIRWRSQWCDRGL